MKRLFTLSSLFFSIFFLFVGNSLLISSAGVMLESQGVDKITIGVVNAGFFFGAILSAIAAHKVISRVGHIRSFSVFGSSLLLGVLLHTFIPWVGAWIALRVMVGFSYYGLLMVVESWLNEKSDSSIRSRILAFYTALFYVAFCFGLLILGMEEEHEKLFIISAILLSLSLIPVSLTKIKEPLLPPPSRLSLPHLFDIAPLALVGSLVGGVLVGGFFTMAPVFILERGMEVKEVSTFMGIAMAGGFLVQIPMGKFSDSYGRKRAIMLASALAFFSSLLAFFFDERIEVLYGAAFILGCGIFTLYSLSLARANDRISDRSNVVEVSRSLLFSYGVGSMVAPLLLGGAMEWAGSSGFIGVYLLFSLALWLYASTQEVVPKEQRSVYVSVPGSAGDRLPELDPRKEGENSKEWDAP